MSEPQFIPGLSAIADQYDAVLCDVWGVLHDGRRAFEKAGLALRRFRESRGPVVLITNAPVPKARVTRLFGPLGVPMDCFDEVVTSGDATRYELELFAPGPVYRIGLSDDRSVYEDLQLTFTDKAEEAAVICATSLREYPEGDPANYRKELSGLAERRVPMICANPDVHFRHGDRLIWAAGALAQIYEELGGRVIRPGKPDAPIYELAGKHINLLAGRAIEPARILAIGDGPATDILGAQRRGLDSLFILHGIVGHRLANGEAADEVASAALREGGARADFVMRELSW